MKKLLLLLLGAVVLFSCKEDKEEEMGLPPVIHLEENRYYVEVGASQLISPTYENTDNSTLYVWTRDGKQVGHEPTYTFKVSTAGTYYLKVTASNRFGSASADIKMEVMEAERDPEEGAYIPESTTDFSWEFPTTEINLAEGRTYKVKAYFIRNDNEATYTWTLNGATVSPAATRAEKPVEYVLSGLSRGDYELALTMQNETESHTQVFLVHVCPPEGTFKRGTSASSQAMVNKIYEYMPAPGHQVNGYRIVGDFGPDGMTMKQACDSVYAHFQRQWMVSLGAQGGYLIAGFDHSVENSGGDYDLCIKGNPYSYQNEPGIIWVSQDENGDGLPNDTWFELAGSEYNTDNEILEYAVTYYKPIEEKRPIYWVDNQGNHGVVPHMDYWNPHPSYWQDWVEGKQKTYFGSYLKNYVTYSGGVSDEPAFEWGYADQSGTDYFNGKIGNSGYYKISNAKTWDGKDASLQYIDFVKVQTAQAAYTNNLGEVSTEVYYISDFHLEK